MTYVSIPDVSMGQRCSVLGCNPRLRILGCAARPAQELGPCWGDNDHARGRHHPGHQDLTQEDASQQTPGTRSSQPKQGGAAEPCTALLHMGKLRHREGCAITSLWGGPPHPKLTGHGKGAAAPGAARPSARRSGGWAAPPPGTPASPLCPPPRCARWGPPRWQSGAPLHREEREAEEEEGERKAPLRGRARSTHHPRGSLPRTSTLKSLRAVVPRPRARQVYRPWWKGCRGLSWS